MNLAAQNLGGLHLFGKVKALRGRHFRGYAKLTIFQCFLKRAHHLFPLMLIVLG